MSLKVDKVQLEIIMKADSARAELIKLEDDSKSLTKELAKVKKQFGENSQEYKSAEQKLSAVKSRMAELKNQIGLTGMTMKELQQRSKELQLQLRNLDPRTPKYRELRNELDQVNNRMRELRGTALQTQSGLSNLANGFNKYFNLVVAGVAAITGLSLTFRKLAEDIANLDDIYSDVMKTTGMTHDEVLALNEEFKKMDTRTAREDLNKIAEAGGRIGVAKNDILEFTQAMDIANVALGDSFVGGVDEISTKLGKLKMLFSETKDMKIEQAYLSIASSINELGANGAASEPNIAEFATRIGSLPEALKPSVAETLALGAAFEESGIEAEISARAYNIFLKQASTESAKFAKVMGISQKEVEKLINTNPMEFFLQFAEGMKGMNATEVAQTLDYLGVNADGANKAIGAAANSTARFRELIDLSNKSFTEGTSVINEYNIKNTNLAAQLDKAKKQFRETALELGQSLNPLLLKSTNATTYLIKGLVELPKWLKENSGMLIALGAGIAYYTVATYASIVADKLKVFWTDKIAVSLGKLLTSVKANPWGLIATGVMLAITWLNKYLNNQKDVNKEQQKFNELAERSKELFNDTKSLEDRAKIMKTLSNGQLETLKTDLETQLSELEKFDAQIKTKSQKALDDDKELQELKIKAGKETNAALKANLSHQVDLRENAILEELGAEYGKNLESKKLIQQYIKDVNALLKTKPTKPDFKPTNSGNTETTKEDPFDVELKAKENSAKEWQLKLKELRRTEKISEEIFNDSMMQSQLQFLEDKKLLQIKYKKSTLDTDNEISDLKLKRQKSSDDVILKAITDQYSAGIKTIESGEKTKELILKEALARNEMTEKEYNLEMKKLDEDALKSKVQLAEATYNAMLTAEFASEELRMSALKTQKEEIEKLKLALKEAGIEFENELNKQGETYSDKMSRIFQGQFSGIGDLFTAFNKLTDKSLTDNLKSWTDWGIAIGSAVEVATQVAQQYSDAYFSYREASLEADKQRELTNAGESAELRDKINQKYAQKELDLKKKRSSAETVLNVAQTLAAGAVAVMQAYKELGPIGGTVAAVLLGGLTGLQVATVIKQNEAIQNTTLDSSVSGSNSSSLSGSRVAVPQAADGRYDVVGAQDRKLYQNVRYMGRARTGMVTTPTLYGEAGTELVIDAPTLRNLNMRAPDFIPFVMAHRVRQRADGNYAPAGSVSPTGSQPDYSGMFAAIYSVISKNNELLDYLKTNGIEAFMLYDKFQKEYKLYQDSINKGSK